MKTTPTPEQVQAHAKATISAVRALAELLASTKGMPSGHLYARVMGHCSIDTYQYLLDIVLAAGLATLKNHWLAPTQLAIDLYGPKSDTAEVPPAPLDDPSTGTVV